jgi:hypothetical protein
MSAEQPPTSKPRCGLCRFFVAPPGRSATTEAKLRDRGFVLRGLCQAHPVSIAKGDDEWCGEFTAAKG